MTFKYESGLPIPPRVVRDKGYTSSVRNLPIGLSVYLPISAAHARAIVQYLVAGSECKAGDYVVRREGDGARIWRN